LATFVGLAAAITLGLLSDGVYHDDDVCHYLFALDSWGDTNAMLHWWARPGYNIPTMFVSHFFGMAGCRIFSALQTAGVAYLAYLIALRVGLRPRWAALAPALVWLQPLTITLAETTLTETPAALYVTLAIWLYLRGNRVWACAAMSLALVTRLELMALVPLMAIGIILDAMRQADWKLGRTLKVRWLWPCAAAMAWAPVAYCVAAYLAELPPDASPLYVLFRQHAKEYGSGPWYHYIVRWPQASGLAIAAAAIAGAISLGRRALAVSVTAFAVLFLHGLLFGLGAFATGGYARFLVPAGGLFAVLAAGGIEGLWHARGRAIVASAVIFAPAVLILVAAHDDYWWAIARQRRDAHFIALALAAVMAPILAAALLPGKNHLLLRAGQLAVVILAVVTAIQVGTQVKPLSLVANNDGMHLVVSQAVEHIRGSKFRNSPALTQHVLVRFLRDDAQTKALSGNDISIRRWRQAKPGTLFFWDSKYCYKKDQMDSTGELYRLLNEWGRLVYECRAPNARAEVYVRQERWQGPAAGGPDAPTTRPAGRATKAEPGTRPLTVGCARQPRSAYRLSRPSHAMIPPAGAAPPG